MDYVAIIDLSSFIWNEHDYENNTHKYYELVMQMPALYDKLDENKSIVLLRTQLFLDILQYFPYNKIPRAYQDFETITLSFLSNLGERMLTYPDIDEPDISSTPNLLKNYFSNSTKTEARYLITRIHKETQPENIYFTFSNLWNDEIDLKTERIVDKEDPTLNEGHSHIRIMASDKEELNAFFLSKKRIFEHSEKHHSGREPGNYESPLSCYKNNDNAVPQEYLDKGAKAGKRYYYFDLSNDVYVVFFPTHKNLYHGHDEADRNKIPPTIRKIFNK